MPTIARSVEDVVAGEAAYGTQTERFDDMFAGASTSTTVHRFMGSRGLIFCKHGDWFGPSQSSRNCD